MNNLDILVSFHSKNEDEKNIITEFLHRNKLDFNLINELEPVKTATRAQWIIKCDAIICITSLDYQKSTCCMECLNFTKDLKKVLFTFNTRNTFRPFGQLGFLINMSSIDLIEMQNQEDLTRRLGEMLIILTDINRNSKIDPIARPMSPSTGLSLSNDPVDVVISYHSETRAVCELIEAAFKRMDIKHVSEETSNGVTNIKACQTIVLVMSKSYEDSQVCQAAIDLARSLNKTIIPVSWTKAWKPSNWLGLITAGKLFFR